MGNFSGPEPAAMNFVYLSPHFPPNYYQFCANLRHLGANVLGLADEPYDQLNPGLKDALTEYYKVNDMHNYDELLRARGYFTNHYGKIDRIDSLNEYWLRPKPSCAPILTSVEGADMRIKRKSHEAAYARPAPGGSGRWCTWRSPPQSVWPGGRQAGYRRGSSQTYKIHSQDELQNSSNKNRLSITSWRFILA
jgi:hypothetical protein